jgi:probable phosphoglycerate mutase
MANEHARIGHPCALHVIRHGQSAGNIANDAALAAGLPELDLATRDMDVPLSELGERQAEALSTWFRDVRRPDVVFSSPYRRALDTARIALDGAGLDVPVLCDERLREREFGILDRLTRAGIEARFPEQAAARGFLGKLYHRPPGGESWVDVAARVRSFYTDLRLDRPGEEIVVVAHQAVVSLFRFVLEDLTEEEVLAIDRSGDFANTGVMTFEGDGRARPSLVSYNDTRHLPDALTTARPDVSVAPR